MVNPQHSAAIGTELHDFVHYAQGSDPGAVGAGRNWLDTSVAASPLLKRRNDANTGWLLVGVPSVLTTKGDLLVFNGTSYVRVPVGANDAVLVADSTQAAGVRWAAAGSGGLTDPSTTKGDLLVRNASALTRLGVGADGQVLQADSAQATGVKWANPSGGYVDPLTTKGDIPARTSVATVRKAVGADSSVLMADSAQTDGLAWQPYADLGFPTPLAGTYLDSRRGVPGLALTTMAAVANTLYSVPIWLRKGESLAGLGLWVTTGAASSAGRFGLYTYNPATGFPDALLWDAGTIATTTNGAAAFAASGAPYIVPATGWYMVAVVFNGTPTVTATSIGQTRAQYLGYPPGNPGSLPSGVAVTRAFTYAALPNPFGGTPAFATGNAVLPFVQMS